MKDADYQHRQVVAMSTTGKLTPIPPRPALAVSPVESKSGRPRPRIAARQPTMPALDDAKPSSLRSFFNTLLRRKA